MQKYITPAPGRTPGANIVDRTDYKLDFNLREYRPSEYLLAISKFIPETGWREQKFFLTTEELAKIRAEINGTR